MIRTRGARGPAFIAAIVLTGGSLYAITAVVTDLKELDRGGYKINFVSAPWRSTSQVELRRMRDAGADEQRGSVFSYSSLEGGIRRAPLRAFSRPPAQAQAKNEYAMARPRRVFGRANSD